MERSDDLEWFRTSFDAIVDNVDTVIRGKHDVIRLAVMCLIAEGHVLIEDVPGVGKTLLAKSIARSIESSFQRIQFTPDLLPSDITGVSVFDRQSSSFIFRPGAIFANIVVGDEINRASPKTQAALLEAMEERQVTVDGTTHPLLPPFMVVATQNPLEHEGTYPLPEAQLDRFMVRLVVGYPDRATTLDILDTHGSSSTFDTLGPVLHADEVIRMAGIAKGVHVSDGVREYLADLVEATRSHAELLLGASPRSALYLLRLARARAASMERDYLSPDDVKAVAEPVLGHRMILRPEAQMRGVDVAEILASILGRVPVPGSIR
ncbi:MAG: MoxR family ATPase [Acidimicrobiia bacterium]